MKKVLSLSLTLLFIQLTAFGQWVSQSPGFTAPNATVLGLSVVNHQVAWAVAFDSAGTTLTREIGRTINGSNTWTISDLGASHVGQQVMDVHGLDANTAWVISMNPFFETGAIFKTTDGGASWNQQTTAAFSTGIPLNVYFFDANNGLVLGDDASGFRICTTANSGTTWNVLPAANLPTALPGERMAGHYGKYMDHLWFGTEKGRIFHSADKGLTWNATGATGLTDISSVTFKNALEGWALGTGGLVRTYNGGQTWSLVQANGPIRQSYVTYVPNTPATLVSAGIFGTDRGSAFSTDGGQNWINLESTEAHTLLRFVNNMVGYSGGIKTNGGGGMFTFLGVLAPTGISEKITAQPLTVFPNPTAGLVTYKLPGFSAKNPSVLVYNVLGQPVYQTAKTIDGKAENQLDLRHLPAGIYQLKVLAGEQVYTSRLVLEK